MANSFTRPPRVVGGNKQAISAKDFNGLSRAIEELQNAIRPSGPKSKKRGNAQSDPLWTTISAVPDSDPASYQATVTLGYLTYQNANATDEEQGVTGYLAPKIRNSDGQWISLEPESPPSVPPVVIPAVPLPALASYVYLRVKTTADGMPDFEDADGPVTIEAFDSEQKSTHHVRPSPSGGEEKGDYYFLILETESNEATPTPAPRAKRRITGNRELPNQLIEIANIGGKRELYQGYLVGPDDKHELRTLEQYEDGNEYEAPVIAPLPDGEEEGETIPFVGLGVKQVSPQRPANFELGEDKKVSKLNFSGYDGGFTIPPAGGTLQFAGGLCTGGSTNGEGEGGKNLNLTVNAIDYDESGAIFGSEYLLYVLYWRNGLYVGTADPGDAPAQLDQRTILSVGV